MPPSTLDFNCQPISANPLMKALVFSWNPHTGEVGGPDADQVRAMAHGGSVQAHPLPWAWALGPDPLKSFTDMAAIVGSHWVLPPALQAHYPVPPDDNMPETTHTDANGLLHLGRDLLTY